MNASLRNVFEYCRTLFSTTATKSTDKMLKYRWYFIQYVCYSVFPFQKIEYFPSCNINKKAVFYSSKPRESICTVVTCQPSGLAVDVWHCMMQDCVSLGSAALPDNVICCSLYTPTISSPGVRSSPVSDESRRLVREFCLDSDCKNIYKDMWNQ